MVKHMQIVLWLSLVCHVAVAGRVAQAELPAPRYLPRAVTVADGYTAELIAGPPLVERPIAVARDERGRLYVTDSGGMSDKAEMQLESRPHRIRRLEDVDGDGIYDRSTLFADQMMFPEGCLWHDGSLYVAAPPEIWKLTDDDDDGVSDRREIWFDGQTLTGCGNDLHGPYRGPDGRMYWCKGAFAEQRHTLDGGRELVTRSSHIFRADASGGALEPVLTGGMDNPVNVAFLPNGDRFLSCTFLQHPADGKRDGLLHAIYGGVYGKRHASILDHPRTGDVMPVLVHRGAAAPCGLIAGSRSLFGGGHARTLFACYFNLHQVVRHQLIQDGPTWRTEDAVLMSSDHPDFHPTDVFEDADGSLIVVDTGGWYKICCPTSLMAKPEVLGGIYRIRRAGVKPPADPLGSEINWQALSEEQRAAELTQQLEDERLFVRRRATDGLRRMGSVAIPPLVELLTGCRDAAVRCDVVWCLAGIDAPASAAAVRMALSDGDAFVRMAAISVCGLRRDGEARRQLEEALLCGDAMICRASAEALGRIGDIRSLPALRQAVEGLGTWIPDAVGAPPGAADRILHHSLTFAIMEIDRPDLLRPDLASAVAAVRQVTLVALDQTSQSDIHPGDVLPLLEDSDPAVRATAVWVAGNHPEWGDAVAEWLRQRILSAASDDSRSEVRELMLGLIGSDAVQGTVVGLFSSSDAAARGVGLDIVARCGLSKLPQHWTQPLARLAAADDRETARQCVESLAILSPELTSETALTRALKDLAVRDGVPAAARIQAALLISPLDEVPAPLFETLLAAMTEGADSTQQSRAARVLGEATVTADQRRLLLNALPHVGPLQLPELLNVLSADASGDHGERLIDALLQSAALPALRQDQVTQLFRAFPDSVQQHAEKAFARHFVSAAEQSARIRSMLETLPAGDVDRGHAVFTGPKAACLKCHKLGYHGGTLGPDLTRIGSVRRPPEILESILFPDATIVRGYEPVTLETVDGLIVGGIITDEASTWVRLGVDGERSVVIERSQIEATHPSAVSPMPRGLEKLLTDQELADLLAFLTREQQ